MNNIYNDIQIINLTKHLDKRGNLLTIEEMKDIPFEIKRSFWIYDIPSGETRSGLLRISPRQKLRQHPRHLLSRFIANCKMVVTKKYEK